MYIIEYQEPTFKKYLTGFKTGYINRTERFQPSRVMEFFERVKELRDAGQTITNTYFID